MSITRIIIALVVVLLVGAGVFLATWEIPPPSDRVEKVVPDARLPR